MRKFQAYVASALCAAKKSPRGRPSLGSVPKKQKVQVNPAPVEDIRFDGVGHFPSFGERRQRCRIFICELPKMQDPFVFEQKPQLFC